MILCPSCQKEYSYGRNIVHLCEHETIFNGRVFCNSTIKFEWNCNEKIDKVKDQVKIYPLIISERKIYYRLNRV